ncbi:MAG: Xaa-Pro peptidase family protein [Thaumarchaeota archaeon]|nr:Xaa-Pro peptidase family protein [Nitrososphaerota archaeon]
MPRQAVDSQKRVRKIFEQIDLASENPPDALILANGVEPHLDASFFYVTGFPYGLFESSYLLAQRNGKISLVTTPLEEPIANAFAKGIEILTVSENEEAGSVLRSVGNGINSLALNSPELNYKSYLDIKSALKNAKLVDASDAFEAARLIKDDSEIEAIQHACDIASDVYKKITRILSEGVTESEVAGKIAFEMQKAGGTGVAFDSIVAFGKNSAEPHYSAGQAELKTGQFVLCDYGTKYRRYCSDITRTLVYGKASSKQKRMYQIIKDALELGTKLCVPENTGAFVHSKVASLIDFTEYKGRFIHSTGHSLGLSVHDGPGLSTRFKKKLQPGMVMTVEPGMYVPGYGGVRIEDDVLITKGKPKVLTSAPRELIEA